MDSIVAGQTTREEQWEPHPRFLPFAVLALSSVVVGGDLVAEGHLRRPSTALIAAMLVVTVVWMWWWQVASERRGSYRRSSIVHYVGRMFLTAVLTVLNPFFCIFAWVGFVDIACFRGRQRWIAAGVVSVIMAIGQVGGVPFDSNWQPPLFAGLLVINFSLSMVMVRRSAQIAETSEQRAGMIAELQRALEENARLHDELLAREHEAGVQQERERLAREIHDTIAQSLAGVVAQLQASQSSDDPDDVRRRVARAADLARTALTDARRSVQDLQPVVLADGGLAGAVGGLVEDWRTDHSGEAALVVTGDARDLHPEVEATVLRIAQEALTNVARHARAKRVGVTLSYDDAEIILDVRDDGIGFDPGLAPRSSAFGLRGMRQRAERLAGALVVESEPGHGTAVSARVPALSRGTR